MPFNLLDRPRRAMALGPDMTISRRRQSAIQRASGHGISAARIQSPSPLSRALRPGESCHRGDPAARPVMESTMSMCVSGLVSSMWPAPTELGIRQGRYSAIRELPKKPDRCSWR